MIVENVVGSVKYCNKADMYVTHSMTNVYLSSQFLSHLSWFIWDRKLRIQLTTTQNIDKTAKRELWQTAAYHEWARSENMREARLDNRREKF